MMDETMDSMNLSDMTSICDRNHFISYLAPASLFILGTFSFVKILFPQLTGSDLPLTF